MRPMMVVAMAPGVESLLRLTDADERDYQASRMAREKVANERQQNNIERARTARDRDAAASQRDRTADERDERGLAREEEAGNSA